jgi:alkanesulfonate monooxygenase SsuD/methylene tetrahydromethanopterin reductase-like flavin-dependent oxidoreductase (luciferase family)
MKLGIVLPQGLTGEYAGWGPQAAARRTIEVARQAEELGFESIWVYDHLGTFGELRDEPTLEAFALLGALTAATRRIRLGPLVARVGLRSPTLLAKHVGTLDAIAGGRFELGLGTGSQNREARAFGFEFPPKAQRLDELAETLEFLRAAFTSGRASADGTYARAVDAIVNPPGPEATRIPLIVGGNAPDTWRVAARLADEINLDTMTPAAAGDALATIRDLCEEVGRDPSTLAVSIHPDPDAVALPGDRRVRLLADFAALGLPRAMALMTGAVTGEGALETLAADARTAGITLGAAT